jgi:hypothetical protein
LNTSSRTLARWLGVSGKAVYDLGRVGVLVRVAGGMYRLEESVRGYCEHLRQAAAQQAIGVAPRATIAGEPVAPP